jgi:hypothetical protein
LIASSSKSLFVNDMTTIDQLQKNINTLKDEIEELERKNDTYEEQLNECTCTMGTVKWTTITTWITETKKQISLIETQIAEKDAQITVIASSSNSLFVYDMSTTDQLRKRIYTLKDKTVKLERKSGTYEEQLNERTSIGAAEWVTIATWFIETKNQINGIQRQIAEIQKQIAFKAAAEKNKEGGTIAAPNFRFSSLCSVPISYLFHIHRSLFVNLLRQQASGPVCIRFSSSSLVQRCNVHRLVLRLEPDRRVPRCRHVYQVPWRRTRGARTRKARTAVV